MTYQELPELLTIKQASALINVHPNTLRNWEREGKVQVVRIGSRRDRRFPKSAIWKLSQGMFVSSVIMEPSLFQNSFGTQSNY